LRRPDIGATSNGPNVTVVQNRVFWTVRSDILLDKRGFICDSPEPVGHPEVWMLSTSQPRVSGLEKMQKIHQQRCIEWNGN
jgi:hypothetical protein